MYEYSFCVPCFYCPLGSLIYITFTVVTRSSNDHDLSRYQMSSRISCG